MADPAHFVAALVEGVAGTELFGDGVEDVEVGARFAQRLDRLVHGDDEIRAAVAGERGAVDSDERASGVASSREDVERPGMGLPRHVD